MVTAGTLGPFRAAEIALRLLHSLALLQPAIDSQGGVVLPPPVVHQQLASERCLPHLAQVCKGSARSLFMEVDAVLRKFNLLKHPGE